MRWSWTLMLALGCGSPDLATERDRFEEDQGLPFATCGTLDLGSPCPEDPSAADAEAVQCLLDAWDACEPAVLEITRTSIEGDPITTVLYVVPDSGDCSIVRFFDTTQDDFAPDPSIVRSTCDSLAPAESCPWIVESACVTE